MTHIMHNEGDLQIYFCAIFLETRHHAQAHITTCALIGWALSLTARRTHKRQRRWVEDFTGQVYYDDSWVAKHLLQPNSVFQPIWGVGRSWFFPASSIKFLTRRSLKSQWVYLVPHEDNSIQLLNIANNYKGLPYLLSSYDWYSFRNLMPQIWMSSTVTAKQI